MVPDTVQEAVFVVVAAMEAIEDFPALLMDKQEIAQVHPGSVEQVAAECPALPDRIANHILPVLLVPVEAFVVAVFRCP